MTKTRAFLMVLLAMLVCSQTTRAQSMSTFSLSSAAPSAHFETTDGKNPSSEPYLEKNRIILLFIPAQYENEGSGYLKHLSEREKDLTDRELKIFVVVGTESPLQKESFGPHIIVASKCDPMPTSMSPNSDSGPIFVLIGKDKNIKLREQKFVSEKALFATIDAMPMRRSEIKAKTAP
jgi:hypothetical protein